jgi:DNA topoisomerase VI subunit B
MYDKVAAVVAELIANSYDADATDVTIQLPLGVYLAKIENRNIIDNGYEIVVKDNGHGMTPNEINDFYLFIGKDRRSEPKLGDESKKYHRKVMGHKGVGKLAPFWILDGCK